MVSMILPTFARTRLIGYAWVVMSAVAIGFLSFGLWVHHMFATGLPLMSLSFFAAASIAIAVPMGVQMFAWLGSLWNGRPVITTPMLFVLGFLSIFTVGGLTGVMVASVPFDWQVHDTYFVVAHLHYVLIGGMLFPVFAALYYWMPLLAGGAMSERLGRWAFAFMFIGFNGAFLPMHLTGLRGMPRRVYTYSDALGVNGLNLTSTVFTFVLGIGILIVLIDFVRHLRSPALTRQNPWNAASLEWLSANLPYGFRSLPTVTTRYPLWDQRDVVDEVREGRGYLPDAPTNERETLMTSPIGAVPEQIVRIPGPSWTPFLSAVAMAVFFVALTFKLPVTTAMSGGAVLVLLVSWMWRLDRAHPRTPTDAGRGLSLPRYTNDGRSLGCWAMVILLIVDASLTIAILFAYLFLWTTRPAVWPPDGSLVPGVREPLVLVAVTGAAYALFEVAAWVNRHDRRALLGACLAGAVLAAATAISLAAPWPARLGIDPTRHSYGAAVWTLLLWAAIHIGIGALMALWCLLRVVAGMLDSWRSVTLRVCVLWWRFTVLATAAVLILIAGFPHAFR
jgi:cytochrome c oxidase subunit I+III